jgi:hypothetical protein
VYPELGGDPPDLECRAASIILRVLNEGDPALQETTLAGYGAERVRVIAIERAHRLTNQAYVSGRRVLTFPPVRRPSSVCTRSGSGSGGWPTTGRGAFDPPGSAVTNAASKSCARVVLHCGRVGRQAS